MYIWSLGPQQSPHKRALLPWECVSVAIVRSPFLFQVVLVSCSRLSLVPVPGCPSLLFQVDLGFPLQVVLVFPFQANLVVSFQVVLVFPFQVVLDFPLQVVVDFTFQVVLDFPSQAVLDFPFRLPSISRSM